MATFLSYQTLSTRRQTNHDHAYPGVLDLDSIAVSIFLVGVQVGGQCVVHVVDAACRLPEGIGKYENKREVAQIWEYPFEPEDERWRSLEGVLGLESKQQPVGDERLLGPLGG